MRGSSHERGGYGRGSLTARDDLQAKVPAFIAYDNRTTAKPFQRPYRGKPLLA